MISPTQRTLAELRRLGYMAAIVEKWNPAVRIRQDLFGCIDLVAIGAGHTLAVQCTSGSNVSARVAKIQGASLLGGPVLPRLLEAGWRVEVWGWRKSAKSRRWELRRVPVELEPVEESPAAGV